MTAWALGWCILRNEHIQVELAIHFPTDEKMAAAVLKKEQGKLKEHAHRQTYSRKENMLVGHQTLIRVCGSFLPPQPSGL